MSRFVEMSQTEWRADSAFSSYSSDGDHPDANRTQEDSGGQTCSPSFYCTDCGRLVFDQKAAVIERVPAGVPILTLLRTHLPEQSRPPRGPLTGPVWSAKIASEHAL